MRCFAAVAAIAALAFVIPAQAAAPTLSGRVAALETQVRALKAQLATNQKLWQAALNKTDAHAVCNNATLYATVARIYVTFGQQIAALGGKTLTPAELPPFDAGDACKIANG